MDDFFSISSLSIWFVVPLAIVLWLLIRRSRSARKQVDIGHQHDEFGNPK